MALTNAQKRIIQSMLRVNQAGELAANGIYKGQYDRIRDSEILEMWNQEKQHLQWFEELMPKYETRPSMLTPVWRILSYGLGLATASLGREAAMACTEAVEKVVGSHYEDQLRILQE